MPSVISDLIAAEVYSPLNGSPIVFVDAVEPLIAEGAVLIALDRQGRLPPLDPGLYDAMMTTHPDAPWPWVSVDPARFDAQLGIIGQTAENCPIATAILSRLLRLSENLDFETALELESLAYSTLLGGSEFRRWLKSRPNEAVAAHDRALVRTEREGDLAIVTLASPNTRNAMTASMRDALYEALVNVLEDPSEPRLLLRAEGKCFSTGGHLAEFGTARDLAQAHVIRTQRSCARILHRLGDRSQVRLAGACIGSGIEVPAAAARRIAAPDLIVQLPELAMGLIPGAGGTATVARAIGRHRLLWLALGAFRIGAGQARSWGLVHVVEP
jgi:hypothetical protein